jgi:hypothetical protein
MPQVRKKRDALRGPREIQLPEIHGVVDEATKRYYVQLRGSSGAGPFPRSRLDQEVRIS